MDSNPTICEEKLTASNPNRKLGFIYIYIYIYILVDEFTKIVSRAFGPFIGHYKGLIACFEIFSWHKIM